MFLASFKELLVVLLMFLPVLFYIIVFLDVFGLDGDFVGL